MSGSIRPTGQMRKTASACMSGGCVSTRTLSQVGLSSSEEQIMKYRQGQRVEYRLLEAGGRDPAEHIRSWIPGFIVIKPVSPYARGCALIKHEDESRFWGLPLNAEYEDIRPITSEE